MNLFIAATSLSSAEGVHGVYAGGAARGDIRGEGDDKQKQSHYAEERPRIIEVHAVEN
jgi:hypothetical protein